MILIVFLVALVVYVFEVSRTKCKVIFECRMGKFFGFLAKYTEIL